MVPFWIHHRGEDLAQGDYLPNCLIPLFGSDFGKDNESEIVPVKRSSLIIVTQSCDLANAKVPFAALCPIFSLEIFESVNPRFKSKGEWEQVRKGRREGLHLLASPDNPQVNRAALVVDFRQIYSLPITYLSNHVSNLGDRWRLQPPFLEHFSQAFARFFMRVGLPSSIPPFK